MKFIFTLAAIAVLGSGCAQRRHAAQGGDFAPLPPTSQRGHGASDFDRAGQGELAPGSERRQPKMAPPSESGDRDTGPELLRPQRDYSIQI